MIKKIVLISLLFLFSILSFSQTQQEIDNISIKANPAPYSESSIKNTLIRNIGFISLKGHPRLYELKDYPDSLTVTMDSAKVTLKSGTSWDPYMNPPESKSITLKVIFKKVDSAATERLHYLKFVSVYEETGKFPYSMIDSLYFSNSYFDKNGEKILKIEFVNKPTSSEDRFNLFDRRILFKKEDN